MSDIEMQFRLPRPYAEPTAKFLLWLVQYVRPRTQAYWDGKGVAAIEGAGGLYYSWRPHGVDRMELVLACGNGATDRHVLTEYVDDEPPLALLLWSWYDLALGLGAVSEGELADVTEQVETWQNVHEGHRWW